MMSFQFPAPVRCIGGISKDFCPVFIPAEVRFNFLLDIFIEHQRRDRQISLGAQTAAQEFVERDFLRFREVRQFIAHPLAGQAFPFGAHGIGKRKLKCRKGIFGNTVQEFQRPFTVWRLSKPLHGDEQIQDEKQNLFR